MGNNNSTKSQETVNKTESKTNNTTKDNSNKNKKPATSLLPNLSINDDIDRAALPEYSMEDVKKHDSKENGVWIAMNGLVYDVTPFLPNHPGGAGFLLEVAGDDATHEFDAAVHSDSARIKSKELVIGKLKKDKTKKQALSLPTSLNPKNTATKPDKPPSKYPSNDSKQNQSSTASKPTQIKFNNMNYDQKNILLLYGTQKGTSKQFTEKLYNALRTQHKKKHIVMENMSNFDAEDLEKESIVIMIISTYENGQPPSDAQYFMKWMNDAPSDCRVHDEFLRNTRVGVFGFGNSLYDANYNKVAKTLYNNLLLLGALPLIPLGLGDGNGDITADFNTWSDRLVPHVVKALDDSQYPQTKALRKAVVAQNDIEDGIVDMEDLGNMMKQETKTEAETVEQKEMLTDRMRSSLVKQGYKVIGSHSGVKLCRWTKSMLRGRGGCYKNTFYGIKSYQCMEMTPSLACANKCVFCWRHHTNPVGKEWKWVTDKPDFILNQAMQNHKQMVKAMKGVPGVIKERLDEAMGRIRHCALSLVGEPIMYPYLNEYLELLHSEKISSFLVTNAQFPDKIKEASYVTQLYVSVDAATKESLKAIDRPLFKDYWQRFIQSLDYLKHKRQRTVYRLTLVKAWNVGDVADYARLIARGLPTFIEVKGVTFCGKSDGSNLTMDNVPFHFEVVRFCEKLCEYLDTDYEIACEHAHSCCVLIAKKDLKVDGKWHTHIDYDKFFELLESGKEFSYTDYMAETPSWAVIGADEHGFNPKETRFVKQRKKNRKQKDQILKKKIDQAMQDIEEDKKKHSDKVSADNNPYLIGKEKQQKCDEDCNCTASVNDSS
eukprot:62360_1